MFNKPDQQRAKLKRNFIFTFLSLLLTSGCILLSYLKQYHTFFFLLHETVCQNNTYGAGCSEDCGHCFSGQQCNHIVGTCPIGCDAGYYNDRCKTGTYRQGQTCKFSSITPHSFQENINLSLTFCYHYFRIKMQSV